MRGYAAIGLDRIKDKTNFGSVLRAAGCFDVSVVLVSGGRMGPSSTDTMKAYKHIPCIEVPDLLDHKPLGAIPVCIEVSEVSYNLINFVHPQQAFYIFGPEDGNIKKEIMDKTTVVTIPSKHCLNLAAAVNVVLYDRLAKQSRK